MAEDAEVLAEIQRLTSAIQQHKATPPPYAPRGRGRGRGRGGGPGGRGGSSYARGVPTHRNATWVAPGLQPPSAPSRSQTTSPFDAATPTDFPMASAEGSRPVTPGASRVGFRSGGVTPVKQQLDQLSVAGDKGKDKQPAPAREVVIDGVVFVADARGNKLVRKPGADPSTVASPAPPSPSLSTPKRTSHLGTTYIRTKAGNLVSLAFARKRKEQADARKKAEDEMRAKGERLDQLVGIVKGVQGARNAAAGGRGRGRGRGRGGYAATRRTKKPKSDKPCRFFQRTGQCTRAHTCPYIHDSSHIAICPLFLRSSCPRPASLCPLSHTPNAHRSPHCAHFPSCTRGAACPYAHVVVSADAPVCREFVEYGWCPAGEECGKRHVRECWRFAETGECNVPGCREPHVLRRTHEEGEDGSTADEEEDEGAGRREGEVQNEGAVLGGSGAAAGAGAGGAGSKRKRRESADLSGAGGPAGISGAAGRRLKKLKDSAGGGGGEGGFSQQQDFVELLVPLEDSEDDEDEEEDEVEEGMSVDSDDLDEDEDEDEEEEEEGQGEEGKAQAPPPDLVQQVHLAKKDPPASFTASADADELDYGLSDDDDDAVQIEQLLRR
ncbi:hypothetical protein JCM10207_003426 [Rhodosporidiobolus poonsookiae]